MSALANSRTTQRTTVCLVALLQCVYLLDFLMLMPLGPDVAQALAFPLAQLSYLSAAYTGSAILAGLLALRYIERFPRKPLLLALLALLALSTLAASLSQDLPSLLLARALTGLCGAPALALGMAMVIDMTAPAERGKAIANVMIGFAAAVVGGVPLALELARLGTWRTPFMLLALAMALLCLIMCWRLAPSQPAQHCAKPALRNLLSTPGVRWACVAQFATQFSAFLLIPYFSAYFLANLGFPRQHLGMLYAAGGLVAFASVQILGRMADRYGFLPSASLASIAFALGAMVFVLPSLPMASLAQNMPALFFILFMAGNAGRNISISTGISQLATPQTRASMMALQSLVQDVAMTVAALSAGFIVHSAADGRLLGGQKLAWLALAFAVLAWLALRAMQRRPEMVEGLEKA